MNRANANHKSNQKNPTSKAFKAVIDNRSVQKGQPQPVLPTPATEQGKPKA